MKVFKNKNCKIFVVTAMIIISAISFGSLNNVIAVSDQEACNRSEACRAAMRNAANASNTANAYQSKVNDLNVEIATKEAEITETKNNIEKLEKEITEKEVELENEQDALAELLVNVHFESDAEPIKILAGASSISDLAEKAAREEVAQEQIGAAANKVKEVKATLESDKIEVENLLTTQEQSKKELDEKRAEQQALVEKYENKADEYEAVVAEETKKKQAEIQAAQMANSSTYAGTSTNAFTGAYNSYPWQNDCPNRQDAYTTYYDGYKIGGYVCECVSYAGWKAYEAYGVVASWGNAYSWDDRARNAGYTVDHNPAARTIGQTDSGYYGHVFWVESVNGDGSINVTEYNNYYSTGLYSGSYHVGDFGSRVIPAGEASGYNYIHF